MVNARTALADRIERDLRLTRHLLDRLPDASMTWRPHERSFSLAGLATHLAKLPHWGAQMLAHDDYDTNRGGGHTNERQTRAAVLELFDRYHVEWRQTFAATSDQMLSSPWTLRRGDVVLESMPRIEAIERFLLHHMIHHRGQLTVYLRLLGVPLPSLYGPTADESL